MNIKQHKLLKTLSVTTSMLALVACAPTETQASDTVAESPAPVATISFSTFVMGSSAAPVKMLEVSNYTCVHCSNHINTMLAKMITDYVDTGKVQLSFQAFTNNAIGAKAAEGAFCAAEQDQFLNFHYKIAKSFNQLTKQSEKTVVKFVKEQAAHIKLDTKAFNACLDSKKYAKQVEAASKNAVDIGLTGTPFFVINGKKMSGEQSYKEWKKTLDSALAGK